MITPLDFEKILFNPELIIRLRDELITFPEHVTVSLSNRCNHRCLWCTAYEYQKNRIEQIDSKKLIQFMKSACKRGLKAVSYIGNGEPAIYPDFISLSETITETGLEQGIFTNGSYPNKINRIFSESFSFVRFSIDSFDKESHEKTHGVKGQFEIVQENIKELLWLRKGSRRKVTIGIQYAFHSVNIEGLEQAAIMAESLGVDYLSYKPVFNRGAVSERVSENQLDERDVNHRLRSIMERYRGKELSVYYRPYQVKNIDKNHLTYQQCYAPYVNANIHENGRMSVCGPRRIHTGIIDEPFEAIIDKIIAFQDGINGLEKCPGGCRYHAFNHLVHLLKNPEERRELHECFL